MTDGVLRCVDTEHLGVWKRAGEMLRRVSETTPEVEYSAWGARVTEFTDEMTYPAMKVVLLVLAGHAEPAIELLVVFPTPIEEGFAGARRHPASLSYWVDMSNSTMEDASAARRAAR